MVTPNGGQPEQEDSHQAAQHKRKAIKSHKEPRRSRARFKRLNIQTKENKENHIDYDPSLPFVKVYKDFPKVYNISDHINDDRASLADVYKKMPKVYLLSDRQSGMEKTAIYDRNDRTLAILSPMGSVQQAASRQSKRPGRPTAKPTNSAVPNLKAEKADKLEALLAHRCARHADAYRSVD